MSKVRALKLSNFLQSYKHSPKENTKSRVSQAHREVVCWDDDEAGVMESLGLLVAIGDVDASFLTAVTVSV